MKKILSILFILALFSCNNMINEAPDNNGHSKLEISLNKSSRTIMPEFYGGEYKYKIGFTGTSVIQPVIIDKTTTSIVLPNGTWDLFVQCLNKDDLVIATGNGNVTLPNTNKIEIELGLNQNGKGHLLVNFNCVIPGEIIVDSVKCSLINNDSKITTILNSTYEGDVVKINHQDLDSGYYVLLLEFNDLLGTPLVPYTDTVHIYDNITTSKEIVLKESEFNTTPVKPENLIIKSTSSGVSLSWEDISSNEQGYTIYRKEKGYFFGELARLDGYNISNYIDTSAEVGKTYIYSVKAYNSLGHSDPLVSNEVTISNDPKVIYVSVGGTGDGLTWGTALGDIQDAIDKAVTYDRIPEIWISKGTYYPTSYPNLTDKSDPKNRHFSLREGVTLYGGFNGNESEKVLRDPWINRTILSGDFNNDDIFSSTSYSTYIKNRSDNAYNIFYLPESIDINNAIIDGLTISGGNAYGDSQDERKGGAINSKGNKIKLLNCIFEYNSCYYSGSVLCSDSPAYFENCIFYRNLSRIVVGSEVYLKNSIISENTSSHIGVSSLIDIDSCTFNNRDINISGTDISVNISNSIIYNSQINLTDYTPFSYLYGNSVISIKNSYFNNLIDGFDSKDFGNNIFHTFNVYGVIKDGILFNSLNDSNGRDNIWLTEDDGLKLTESSVGIDTGDVSSLTRDSNDIDYDGNFIETTDSDITGNKRIQGNKNDIGAYESPYVDNTPPGIISNLIISPLTSSLKLTWDNPVDNDLYKVIITEDNSLFDQIDIYNFESSTVINSLENNIEYNISIVTEDFAGNKSSISVQGNGTPVNSVVPDVINSRIVSSNKQNYLTWNKPESFEYKNIEITWTDIYGVKKVKYLEPETIEETFTELENGTVYNYNIKVIDHSGEKSQGITLTGKPGEIVYVDPMADSLGNGSSWSNALNDPGLAMYYSSIGTQVWVKEGTYKPQFNPQDLSDTEAKNYHFSLGEKVSVYGGFKGNETLLNERDIVNNKTVLSGDLNDDDIITGSGETLSIDNNSDNVKTVFRCENGYSSSSVKTIIDGFTITGGNNIDDNGGGAKLYSSYLYVVNCIIEGNQAKNGGGLEHRQAYLINSVISRNIASKFGGGAYCNNYGNMQNVVVEGNKAENGGGLYLTIWSKSFRNITVANNYASKSGGGIIGANCDINLYNSILFNNKAVEDGTEYYQYGTKKIKFLNNLIKDYPGSCYLKDGDTNNEWKDIISGGILFKDLLNPAGSDNLWLSDDDGLQYNEGSTSIDCGDFSLAGNDALDGDGDGNFNEYSTYDILFNKRNSGNNVDLGAYESPFEDTQAPGEVVSPAVLLDFDKLVGKVTWNDPVDFDLKHIKISYTKDDGTQFEIILEKGVQLLFLSDLTEGNTYDIKIQAMDVSGNVSTGTVISYKHEILI